MSLEDMEIRVPDIEDLMPQRDIKLEDDTYRVYLEEKVVETDRCFGIRKIDDSKDIQLFQITTGTRSDQGDPRIALSKLSIQDDDTAEFLLKNAIDLLHRSEKMLFVAQMKMGDFSKQISINNDNYLLTHQIDTRGAINLRDQYSARVKKRIYNS